MLHEDRKETDQGVLHVESVPICSTSLGVAVRQPGPIFHGVAQFGDIPYPLSTIRHNSVVGQLPSSPKGGLMGCDEPTRNDCARDATFCHLVCAFSMTTRDSSFPHCSSRLCCSFVRIPVHRIRPVDCRKNVSYKTYGIWRSDMCSNNNYYTI